MRVRIISKDDVSLLVRNITADNLVLRIINHEDDIVRFKIQESDPSVGVFVVKLFFKNSTNISNSQVTCISE